VYKQQNASWRVRSGDKTTKCRYFCIQGARLGWRRQWVQVM